ncbi:MAG: hypothetical protein BMS9Abin23_0943 [Thermodesulfobacteriota bacterium]|nr:MAG: hypothetical protein BMS9Abin23_0943 [Thermodesulfobacteriota bacterium]
MKKFEICIRGDNFLVERHGEVKKNGFYAVRFVEAEDTSKAVDKAMDSFRTELKDKVLNDKSDPPVMSVADVRDVYFFEKLMEVGEVLLPPTGFLWDE